MREAATALQKSMKETKWETKEMKRTMWFENNFLLSLQQAFTIKIANIITSVHDQRQPEKINRPARIIEKLGYRKIHDAMQVI